MKKRTFEYSPEKSEDFGVIIAHRNLQVPSNYKYIHTNLIFRLFSFIIYYFLAVPILWTLGKLLNRVKVKNKKVLKQLKKSGYFIYSNHTLWLDGFTQHIFTARPKRTIVISLADTFASNKIFGFFLSLLGGFPLPGDFKSARNFLKGMEYYLEKKWCIVIYPEGTIWPYYTGQRPCKKGSFKYPRIFNKPVVFACTTYRKPRGIFKKFLNPGMTITLSDPIIPTRNEVEKIDEARLEVQYKEFIEKVSSSTDNYSANSYIPKRLNKDYLDYINEAIDSYPNFDIETTVELEVSKIKKGQKK